MFKPTCRTLSLLMLGCLNLLGQTISSNIIGTVTDQAGAVISNTPVKLTEQGSHAAIVKQLKDALR